MRITGYSFVFIFLFVFTSSILTAQNLAGGEILGYVDQTKQKLEIKLNLFTNCYSQHPVKAKLYLKCAATGQLIDSLSLTMTAPKDISGLCPEQCSHCSNLNCSFPYGYRLYEYKGNFNLTGISGCQEVCVYFQSFKRSSTITTGSAASDFYIESRFSLLNTSSVAYPQFISSPRFLLCRNQDYYENQALFSHPLDSVVYELNTPKKSGSQAISYSGSYSYNKPISFWGFPNAGLNYPRGFHLDPKTADIYFRPQQDQESPIAVKASIYRNGQFVAEITREWLLLVNSCNSNYSPTLSGPFSREICSDNTESITITASDFDAGDSLTFYSNPNSHYSVISQDYSNPNKPKETIEFAWDYEDAGSLPKIISVTVKDNKCPIQGSQTRAYQIKVNQGIRANIEVADSGCGRYYFSLVNIAGDLSSVNWTGEGGLNSTKTSFTHQFFAADTFYYSVELTSVNGCKYYYADKILTTIIRPIVNAGLDDTACFQGAAVELFGSPFPSQGIWTGEGVVKVNSTWYFDPAVSGLQKNKWYELIYTYTPTSGCSNSDSMRIYLLETIKPNAGVDKTICESSTLYQLTGNPPKGKWSGTGVVNGKFDPSIGTGNYLLVYEIATEGICPDSDTLEINVVPKPEVNFSASVINGNVPLTVTFSDSSFIKSGQIASYQWNFGDGDTSHQFGSVNHTYLTSGQFSVILLCESNNGCQSYKLKPNFINSWPLSIGEIESKVLIYPNPAIDHIIINSVDEIIKNVELFDLMGKKFLSRELSDNHVVLNVTEFTGVYIIQIEFDSGRMIKKKVVIY